MSVKKMVEIYVQYECDEKVWNMFRTMYETGIITYDKWSAFYNKCKGYYFDSELRKVVFE